MPALCSYVPGWYRRVRTRCAAFADCLLVMITCRPQRGGLWRNTAGFVLDPCDRLSAAQSDRSSGVAMSRTGGETGNLAARDSGQVIHYRRPPKARTVGVTGQHQRRVSVVTEYRRCW